MGWRCSTLSRLARHPTIGNGARMNFKNEAKSQTTAPQWRVAMFFCAVPAFYFLTSAAYALAHYADYASDGLRFARYVAGPMLIGLLLVSALALPSRISL